MNDPIAHLPEISRGTFAGLPAILIATPAARAAVSLFGAQLLSYAPAGHDDLLWVSPGTLLPPKPIRGGVPLCWPWFARQGVPDAAPQHGLARIVPWKIVFAQRRDHGEIALSLEPDAGPLDGMRIELALTIGATLTQSLKTTNLTAAERSLTQAFHSYFRVGDPKQCRIEGIQGLDYLDKPANFARRTQTGPWQLDGECDRVYLGARGDYALVDPVLGRQIRIRAANARTLVVWNPGPARVKTISDVSPEGWRDYLCLEVANAGDEVVALAPGGACAIAQEWAVERMG